MFKLNIPLAPLVRILVLAAFLVTAVHSSALAFSFTVVNQTGQTITGLYLQLCDSLSDNLINNKVLVNGESCTITGPDILPHLNIIAVMGVQHKRWDRVPLKPSRYVLR